MTTSAAVRDHERVFGQGYDFIVVGAGTAGCLMAHRCAAAGARVLLLEAGHDIPPNVVPEDIADLYPRSYYNSAYMWPGLVAKHRADDRAPSTFPQGRIMGGGSNLMGMIALRGLPHNYARWEDSGAKGWGWPEVADAFSRVEADRDVPPENAGPHGPVTIRRHRPEDWPPLAQAAGVAANRLGYPILRDFNRDFDDGYSGLPLSMTLSHRVAASSAFLDEQTRARPGLTIVCDVTVAALLLEHGVCRGVTVLAGDKRYSVRATETVLCAGAIQSPALLMRSGIGPEPDLHRAGIPLQAKLAGVGQNLQNHPIIYLAAYVKPHGRQEPSLRPGFTSALRVSSGLPDGSPGDLMIYVLNKSSWHGVGNATAGLGVTLFDPRSRGSLTVRSADASVAPDIDFQMMSAQADIDRLGFGFSVAAELMRSPEVTALRHEVFVAGYTRVVRALNQPGRRNVAITRVLLGMLDGPRPLRRGMLRVGIAGRDLSEGRLVDQHWLHDTAAKRSFGTYHPAGTCAMGAPEDPVSVVDPSGAVHGVRGLRVADASVMPNLPSANTFLPTLMVSERISAAVLAGH